jgi:hypothetical protein
MEHFGPAGAEDDDWFSPDFLPSPDGDEIVFDSCVSRIVESDDTSPNHEEPDAGLRSSVVPRRKERVFVCEPSFVPMFPALFRSLDPVAVNLDSGDEFRVLCNSNTPLLHPRDLGFLPLQWPDTPHTFGDLVRRFFQKRNSSHTRFLHKLFNALKIEEHEPVLYDGVGVKWVSDDLIQVDKHKFGRLLGIRSIDGSLFHKQGNFPSHGFVELTLGQAKRFLTTEALRRIDFENVRLLRHEPGVFVRGCGPDVDESCRWINSRRKGHTKST